MANVTIRSATLDDVERIVRWNVLLAAESEDKQLSSAVLTDGVRQVLADTQKGRYFIAEIDGQPIGQTMVTYEWSDWRNGPIWWIQSVYVEPDHRRQGVYRSLHQHITTEARHHGAVGLRLYVERDNTIAQQVYQNVGIKYAGYLVHEQMFPT